MDIAKKIAEELEIKVTQVEAAVCGVLSMAEVRSWEAVSLIMSS